MERASSGSGSPPNSSESLNGLKFGKTIYFEDVGIGVPFKSSGGSSSVAGSGNPSSSQVPAKKVKSCGSGSAVSQIPRCQVEGCKVDLSDVKAYYSRHKVCGMHSKSPRVIVSGLEQRFCQQCSRFHQLPEFDQGKRSCRRRLAGHNERRRKPPPGSILPSRYGQLSSSIFENSGHGGGFLLDFSSHQRLPERDLWPTARSPVRVAGNQITPAGKFLSNPWENDNDNPPSNNLFLQGGSSNATGFPSSSFPVGDFFAGLANSGCALSLLSNQPWSGSRPRVSDLEVSNFVHSEGAPFGHLPAQAAPINPFQTPSESFKGNDVSGISHEMAPDLGLSQIWQPRNSQISCEFESSSQLNGRQYMELEHPRAAYNFPTHHVYWSL